MIDKYGALLHERWLDDGVNSNEIFAFWAEDGCHYKIICPVQLRSLLVQMQNQLCDLYKDYQKKEKDARDMKWFLNKIFP